ncbi:MAG: GAF domain-containing protein [Anaerolineales bacterium]|jgi:GAF domain-containing protein|nr:GAF domain-containing protein [Anaerolineales bacterium]
MERTPSDTPPLNPENATRELYKNWREQFAIPLLIGVLVFGALALIPAVSASESILLDAIFITTYLITGLVTVIRFSYLVRMSVFLAGVFVLGLAELLTYGILGDGLFFFLAVVIFSTILLSPKAGILATAVNIAAFILFGWLMMSGQLAPFNPGAAPSKIEDWFSASAALVMFGAVIIIGFQRLEAAFFEAQKQIDITLNTLKQERNNLENRVQERTYLLRKINEVGSAVSSILHADEMLEKAALQIEREFDCSFTAFYLLDVTGQWAELKEASGAAGKVMRENKRRLDLSGKHSITDAIVSKQGQINLDIQKLRSENPLLPYTRSQIVLPLIVGDYVLGALDMHSAKDDAFSAQDLDAYQNMANGIAIAMENANLFQEARQSLQEMQATQRQYIQGAWQSLTAEQTLEYALGDNDPAYTNTIEVPLSLREQVIGQIQLANSTEWTPEQKNLVEAIAAQATLALENARLVEESQSSATQERLANEIIAKIWASANTDGILQTAVRELGRSLEAAEVEIELSMGDENDK